jgi:outer membrane protein assembly factor BamB
LLLFRGLFLPALPACLALLGCGGRSQLDVDVGSGTGSGSTASGDVCHAAVSGPKPMAGNCSTRDGRSRVAAPTAPHVTWTAKLPTDSSGELGPGSPGGEILWTSVDLGTLGPVPADDGEVDPSTIALGTDDLVVIVVGVLAAGGQESAVASAFDPATGATRWTTTLPGGLTGGPMIRSDGTIVALTSAGVAGDLVLLDPGTGAATTAPLPTGVFEVYAVTEGGAVIGGLDAAKGGGIIAIGDDGTTLWTNPNGYGATIASDGTIITFGLEIAAIDPATGETMWTLAPPGPQPCIMDAALTSDRGIVALLCDGTLFGASD